MTLWDRFWAGANCKTRIGAGSARLVDDLQVLDASRSYVPGSLWAGLGNGRGNFTDGAGVLWFYFVHACYQQGAPHCAGVWLFKKARRQNTHLSTYIPCMTSVSFVSAVWHI